MPDHKCPPQVKDLPRETQIGVTCRSCGVQWAESVRQLVETHRLGAEYVDLLEWKYRCQDEDCGGMVRFAFDCEIDLSPYIKPQVLTLSGPKRVERLPYPSKAVVKPRTYEAPVLSARFAQLSLPLSNRLPH